MAVAMLAIAAAIDFRKREMDDRYWIAFGIPAAALYMFDYSQMNLALAALSGGLGSAAGYVLYRTGLFGGADALALATFSLILPTYSGGLLLTGQAFAHPLSPLTILSNAVVLSPAHLAVNVIKNARNRHGQPPLFAGFEGETRARKALALLLGHRSTGQEFAFLMETTRGGLRGFDFSLKHAEYTPFESRREVWVMPGIPFLAYLLAGLVAMLFVGDLAFIVLSAIVNLV
jgi:preflagellin peptidase FlaK